MPPRARSKRMPVPWVKIGLGIAVLLALGAVWRWTPLADYVTAKQILQWARELRNVPWAPYALALAYTPAAFILFPQPPMTLFAVLAFGPWVGTSSVLSGKIIAALATYASGRYLKRKTLDKLSGGRTADAKALAHEHGVLAMVAANFAPFPPFAVQGMIAGALKMPLWQYVLGTFLSALPGVLAAAFFARELLAAMDEESQANWWALGAAVIFMIAIPFAVKHWVQKRHSGINGEKSGKKNGTRNVTQKS